MMSNSASTIKNDVNNDKVAIAKSISELELQLQNIFNSNLLDHDFTLLNGFLTFVHSKLENFLDSNLNLIIEATTDDKINQANFNLGVDNIMNLLTLSWEKLWNPVFRWFQIWHQSLVSVNDPRKIKYPEFRRLNVHLTKFSTIITEIYAKVSKTLFINYNVEKVIPFELIFKGLPIFDQLGSEVKGQLKENDTRLQITKVSTLLIPGLKLIFHRCILYVGCINKYKCIMSRANTNNFISDFKLSLQYINNSIKLLPTLGESFYQRSLVELQCNHVGLTIYDLLRASLASIPDGQALNSYQAIMLNSENPTNKKLKNLIATIYIDSSSNPEKLLNREIIEYFPLAIIGSKINPNSWVDPDKKHTLQGSRISLKQLEMMFFEKISTRYIRNMELILKNLLTLFSAFQMQVIQWEKTANIRNISLTELENYDLSLLKFIFKYIGVVLDKIILKGWDKELNSSEYLSIIKIIFLWLQTNKFALEYSQSDPLFNQELALLLNSIVLSRITKNVLFKDENVLVKRGYIFDEEIMLRGFTCIAIPKFVGTNDEDIYKLDATVERFYGKIPEGEHPTTKAENYIRLESIVILGKQFMKYNRCDIILNKETGQYIIPVGLVQKLGVKTASKNIITLERANPKRGILNLKKKANTQNRANDVNDSVLSFDEIETKLRENQQRQSAEWGYSGSSAVAPSNINVKPSFDMAPSSVSTNDESKTPSPVNSYKEITGSRNDAKRTESQITQARESTYKIPVEESFQKLSLSTSNISGENPKSEKENIPDRFKLNYGSNPPFSSYPSAMASNASILMEYPNKQYPNNSFYPMPNNAQDLYFSNPGYPMTNQISPAQYAMPSSMAYPYSGYDYQNQPSMSYPSTEPQLRSQYWNNNSNIVNNNATNINPNMMSNSNHMMSQGYQHYPPTSS
ncbi:nonsense-mediated mRNA decay factor Ebs1p [Monosporozyma servazzii]